MTFLGIDLGTSGLRALLMEGDGSVLGSAEAHYEVSHPHPGWSEQDPAAWITALNAAVSDLRQQNKGFERLKGIGVAGHMHGATCLDAQDQVIRPCILWNDTRAAEQAAQLDQTEDVRALSGNIVFPGFTAPKLMWMAKHEPDNFARVAKVLLPAAYLNFYLTGDHVADMSDSAGTSWLDVGARGWSKALLKAAGMTMHQMPRLVEGSEKAGELRPDLLRDWGLNEAVAVAGGAGDNAAAACGIGAMSEGQGFVSLGTSGVVLAARDGYAPDPASAVHTFCHAVPGRWYQMGVMLSATDSLNWLSSITGQGQAELTAALGDTLHSPSDVEFLPYLSGERTPHNDADLRGAFFHLSASTGTSDLTAAVIEGVSFGLRGSLEALRGTGAQMDRLTAIGGGTNSAYWTKLLATILGIPLELPAGGEFGAALGAARLGQAAATGTDPAMLMTAPAVGETIEPDAALQAAYDDRYARFRTRYSMLKLIDA